MKRLDVIIDALTCDYGFYDVPKLKEALAAARELRELKPVAWKEKNTTFCSTCKDLCEDDDDEPIPLYALGDDK